MTDFISTKANEDGEYDLQMMPMMFQPFMTLAKNDIHNRVELHLRGEFGSPQASTKELTELSHLSERYPTCLVYINSVGGRVDLLREIAAMLEKFEHVITIVNSNANSAGLMLWAVGHVRVVCPYAELMAHREASGYMEKTDAMIDRGEFLKRRFERMFVDMCGGVLTDEEIEKARYTEVWLLGQDMIDRGVAISWEQFCDFDTLPVETLPVISRNGKSFVKTTDGNLLEVELQIDQSKLISFLDVMYGIDPPTTMSLGDSNEQSIEEVADVESTSKNEVKQFTLIDEYQIKDGKIVKSDQETDDIDDGEIRHILRLIFGKGQFRLGVNKIEVKLNSIFHELSTSHRRYGFSRRENFYEDLNNFCYDMNIELKGL